VDVSRGSEVQLHHVGGVDHSTAGGRARAHYRRPLVLWLVILVTVSGVATAGRVAGSGPEARHVAPARTDPGAVAASSPGRPQRAPLPEMIVLSSPAVANATITTRQLAVRGYLATGSGTIEITLEARGNRIIDSTTIDPSLVFGERPTVGRHAQFETRFGLPNPRPNGRMIVQVALVDQTGRIIDVIRRPIRVGPLLEGTGA
jgi:hypothetical protein